MDNEDKLRVSIALLQSPDSGMEVQEQAKANIYSSFADLTAKVKELESWKEKYKNGCQDDSTQCPFLSDLSDGRRAIEAMEIVKKIATDKTASYEEIIFELLTFITHYEKEST